MLRLTLITAFVAAVAASSYDNVATTTSSASVSANPTASGGSCDAQFVICKTLPNENNSFCVSQYVGCLGYNPFTTSGSTSSVSVSMTSSVSVNPTASGGSCDAQFVICKTLPEENNSFCVSQYVGCLGYNPFTTSSSVSASTTSSVTANPTASGGSCDAQFVICKTLPEENNSFCVSQYVGCLGYNPFTTSGSVSISTANPTASGGSCDAQFVICKTLPEANNAFCASQYAGCLGYNPFTTAAATTSSEAVVYTTEVVTAYTTYCPAPTVITQGTQTYTVTAPTTLTITNCPCTITKPETTTVPPAQYTSPTSSAPTYPNTTSSAPVYANTTVPAVVYTTEVVTVLTTYCPSATIITNNGQTYTATASQTLTITNCPCTITQASTPAASQPTPSTPAPSGPAVVSEFTDGQPQATAPAGSAPAVSTPAVIQPAPSTPVSVPAVSPAPSGPAVVSEFTDGQPQATAPAGSAPAPAVSSPAVVSEFTDGQPQATAPAGPAPATLVTTSLFTAAAAASQTIVAGGADKVVGPFAGLLMAAAGFAAML